ncbi:alpha/beta hydrolase [Mycobacterium heckeshornense]|uniref:Lipase n=1 Tax=Mycobacterium heckeshornense TaxID=110505 RepID=A0A2G8BA83_9MYCO|nr:alpha/beta hydrolase [Mycobacterium heckeshornense]KMV23135.1 lipase [Mycobacterium heckeshornense]MCV7035209.1 alpha/beta hydrolase [Mycobacterium heckeshornense]PIJ34667.1 alpha/beta hydrolase [Mycobacterium heckeshornense]BCO37005.1 lipase [Mycobacterium heckeshornense]BCQ09886.1 lipase [Mycobacterium heckeshornense]
MTKSLPGAPDLHRWSTRLQGTATRVGLKVIPWIPAGAKRLLTGGRSVIIDGNTLDPTLQLLLAAQRAVGINGLVVDDDVVASRILMREGCLALPGPQIHVAVNDVSIPGPAGDIAARHYRPAVAGPTPLLVFYHGGGWTIGDLDTHDALCRLTCRDADIHVLSVDYRLAPEHPAPAALDDAYAAFRWAHEHAAGLGAIPGKVAVGGDSAGGNLAAVVSQLARADGGPRPALQWLIYPRTDFTARTRSLSLFADGFLLTKRDVDWFETQYLADSDLEPTDPRISPLLADDLSGLPPALIATAGFDPLRDEGEQYAAALRAAGTAVDLRSMRSLTHGFATLFPLGGGSAVGTAEIVSALRAHLSRV